jgi:GNAT superfamily N-acetyltransferase
MQSIAFERIDLGRHADVCIGFRRDAYFCSFDSGDPFDADTGGATGYLEWLRGRALALPDGIVHVWRADRIIGQIEAQVRQAPCGGYVNLFYLVPEERGSGVGNVLHEYVVALFIRHGALSARLSVSSANARALRYYTKHGWRDLGERPDDPRVHLMELSLAATGPG